MISCEAPDLTRRAGNRRHRREKEQNDQERDKDAGRGVRASGRVDDVDDRVARILKCGQSELFDVRGWDHDILLR